MLPCVPVALTTREAVACPKAHRSSASIPAMENVMSRATAVLFLLLAASCDRVSDYAAPGILRLNSGGVRRYELPPSHGTLVTAGAVLNPGGLSSYLRVTNMQPDALRVELVPSTLMD